MLRKKRKLFKKPKKLSILIFAVVFASIGGYFIYDTFAATPDDLVASGASVYTKNIAVGIQVNPNKTGGYFLDQYGGIQPFRLGKNELPPLPKGTASWPNANIARDFVITDWNKPAGYTLDLYGAMHPFGGAPSAKGTPYFNFDIARKAVVNGAKTGGFVLDGFGGMHAFGIGTNAAPTQLKGNPYWRGWDIVRSAIMNPNANQGYVLDGFCGIHPFSYNGAPLPPYPSSNTGYIAQDLCEDIVVTDWSKPAGYVLRRDGGLYPFGGASAGVGAQSFKPGVPLMGAASAGGTDIWVVAQNGALYSFVTPNQVLKASAGYYGKNRERMGFSLGGGAFNGISQEEYFNYMAMTGVKYVGAEFTQYTLNPRRDYSQGGNENGFDFNYSDQLMSQIRRIKGEAVVTLNGTATWDGAYNRKPNNFDAWATFAGRVAQQYPDIKYFAIWNEPNIANYWGTPSFSEYSSLLCKAYTKIKAVNPKAIIIAGNFAPAGNAAGNFAPDTFMFGMYASGARDCFDATSHHPYQWDAPITAPYGFQTTNKIRDVMVAFADGGKKIWANEIGFPSKRPPNYGLFVLTEQQQADYVDIYLNNWWYQSWGSYGFTGPWLQFKLFENGDDPGFGLITAEKRLKPALGKYVDYGNKNQ